MNRSKALACLRDVFRKAPDSVRQALLQRRFGLLYEGAPGWRYFPFDDTIETTSVVVGGN